MKPGPNTQGTLIEPPEGHIRQSLLDLHMAADLFEGSISYTAQLFQQARFRIAANWKSVQKDILFIFDRTEFLANGLKYLVGLLKGHSCISNQ